MRVAGPGGWLAATLLLWLALLPAVARAQRLDLTPEQAAWIAAHPVVTVALAPDFPPYCFFPANAAEPWGFLVEALDLVAQRTGLEFRYQRHASAGAALAALDAHRADLVPMAPAALDRRHYLRLARPLLATRLVVAARRDLPDVSPTDDFGDRRIAVQAGSDAERLLAERHPGATVQTFARADLALRAVATGAADLFIGYQHETVFFIERDLLANVELRSHAGVGDTPLGPVLRPDQTQLAAILERALGAITPADRSRLAARWLPAGVLAAQPATTAELTDGELAWVEAHRRIGVGYDATFAPITFTGELGEFRGLGADFLKLATDKAGLEVVRAVGGSFADLSRRVRAGELDVFVGMARTPERRLAYDFVGPFLRVPTAIVTRLDSDGIDDLALAGRARVGLLRDHFLLPELRARYPGIQLVELDRQDQVLSALAEGAVELAIGNIKVVSDLIERRWAGRLLISGTVHDGDSELWFGVPRDKPELARVLRKGLEAVNEREQSEVLARWLSIEVRPRMAWRELARTAGPLLLALLVGLALLWRAQAQASRARGVEAHGRQLAEEATRSRGRFLAYLSHELRGSLGGITQGVEMLRGPIADSTRNRLLLAIGSSAHTLRSLLDTTLEYEQNLARPIVLRPESVRLDDWLDGALAPARIAAEAKGLALDWQTDGLDRSARIDPLRLGQVVGNLMGNAIKFTPAGLVRIEAVLSTATDGGRGRLQLTVTDSGPGLTQEELATLFEPYVQGEQGRQLREGAGLGLAITRQLVAAMGGELAAANAPGGGARFSVTLPLDLD
ncbi:transporter substrate-binding domain-containing protein [Derxia lacustris]|uniref:transporter substrate-binding domain-containing protein n=1 Tax=Derxia lacustris TaxID=764842 RepID=UPI0015941121|nr:transporter substrate-binding domain-containing protein [Derxia lacustris]